MLAAAAGPLHVDDIAAGCGLPPGAALARLLELEVAGVAEQLSGKRFQTLARPKRDRHSLPQPAATDPL